MPQTIDVTGLPPEAVRAVETLVGMLREKASPAGSEQPRPGVGPGPSGDPQEWVRWWRAWCASHPRLDVIADDSRESIYDRGTE